MLIYREVGKKRNLKKNVTVQNLTVEEENGRNPGGVEVPGGYEFGSMAGKGAVFSPLPLHPDEFSPLAGEVYRMPLDRDRISEPS